MSAWSPTRGCAARAIRGAASSSGGSGRPSPCYRRPAMMGVGSSVLPRGRDGVLVASAGLLALAGGAAMAAAAYFVHPLALPLALAGVAFVVIAFLRPAWGLAGALLLVPLETANLPLPTGAVSPSEGALAVVGLVWLVRLALRPETVVHPRVRDLPLLVVLLIVLAGVTIAVDPAP